MRSTYFFKSNFFACFCAFSASSVARKQWACDMAVSVRSSGADVHAFRQRYRLSAREGQITELVLRGLGNREIAQSLSISLATAKKHLGKIFDKVGVDSRGQLMARLG